MKSSYIGLFCFLLNFFSYAENQETFIVRVFDQYTQAVIPKVQHKTFSFIFENFSSIPIRGKVVVNDKKEKTTFFTLKVRGKKVIPMTSENFEGAVFYPLNPPGVEVILKYGMKSYEIPTQKKPQ